MSKSDKSIDPLNQIVGQRIKTAIKLKGLTQKKVAKMINYEESSFSDMLSGRSGISKQALVKISEILECSTDFFLGLNDIPTKNPLVPEISEYTGLSAGAIERLHSFMSPEFYDRYMDISVVDPRFPEYMKERLKEEFGDDKLFISLLEPKSIVWLSNFITYSTTSLKMENEFIGYTIESIRKMGIDSAQKEILSQLNNDSSDSVELNQLYNQIILSQENCASHIAIIKESIISDFSKFCNWYFEELEKNAEKTYLENTKGITPSDE